jgi:hypothetical protein
MEGKDKFLFVNYSGEPDVANQASLPTVRQHVMHDFFRRQREADNDASPEEVSAPEISAAKTKNTRRRNTNTRQAASQARPKRSSVKRSSRARKDNPQLHRQSSASSFEPTHSPEPPGDVSISISKRTSLSNFGYMKSKPFCGMPDNDLKLSPVTRVQPPSPPKTQVAPRSVIMRPLDQRHSLVKSSALETSKPTSHWKPDLLITLPIQITTDTQIRCVEMLNERGFQLPLGYEQRSILMVLDCCYASGVSGSTLWPPDSTTWFLQTVDRLYEKYIARVPHASDLDTEGISKFSLVSGRPKCNSEWPYPFGHYKKTPRSPTPDTGVVIQEIDSDDEAAEDYERPVSSSDSDHSISSSDTGSMTSSDSDLNDLDDLFLDTEGSRLRSWLLMRSKSQPFFRHLQLQVAYQEHNSSEPRDQSTDSSSKYASGSSSSSSSTSSSVPTACSSGTSSGSKRRRDDAGEKDKQPGKKGRVPRDEDEDERTSAPRLACFYNKYDPMMYRSNAQTGKKFEICETHDWQDMGRL